MIRQALAALMLMALPAAAQDAQTLADIRTELGQLRGQITALNGELSKTGGGASAPVAGSALDRLNAMEAELSRLTSKTEELEQRINRVVADGTNRIGDLEFRVCEVTPGCDVGSLSETKPIGGGGGAPAPVATPAPTGPEMAVGEQSDFSKAKEAFDSGDFRSAADLFATYTETYPVGALTSEAFYWRGEALMSLGDTSNAARSWLKGFSDNPQGTKAPESLLKLGLALNALGQSQEACVTLGEVAARYPGTQAAGDAGQQRAALHCG